MHYPVILDDLILYNDAAVQCFMLVARVAHLTSCTECHLDTTQVYVCNNYVRHLPLKRMSRILNLIQNRFIFKLDFLSESFHVVAHIASSYIAIDNVE